MAMNAVRGLIRNTIAGRNSVFRLMSARTQATSTAPAPTSGSAADMVFTFASPSEVKFAKEKASEKMIESLFSIRFFSIKRKMFDKLTSQQSVEIWVFSVSLPWRDEEFLSNMSSAHHVPILGVLKPGVVSVFETDGNTKRFFGKKKETHRGEKKTIFRWLQ